MNNKLRKRNKNEQNNSHGNGGCMQPGHQCNFHYKFYMHTRTLIQNLDDGMRECEEFYCTNLSQINNFWVKNCPTTVESEKHTTVMVKFWQQQHVASV